MIPELVTISAHTQWAMLPAGIHPTNLAEIEARFAKTPHRKRLFSGFCRAAGNLQSAGCKTVYLDGSFVTEKHHPNDFDATWDPTGVDPDKLDPVLLNFKNKREAQKSKYGGELFIATSPAAMGIDYLDFFQHDRDTGLRKGILSIQLDGAI
jgi:hypothetical protein